MLDEILDRIKVILFGSKACGNEVPLSDIDLIIIAKSNKSFNERLKETVYSIPFPNVDSIV